MFICVVFLDSKDGRSIPEPWSPGCRVPKAGLQPPAPWDAAIAGSCNRNRLRSVGKEGTILLDCSLQKYAQLLRGRREGGSSVLAGFWLEIHSQLCTSFQRCLVCLFGGFLPSYLNFYLFQIDNLMASSRYSLLQNIQALLFSYSRP